ncbi:MAG TPA: hypothetical protein VGK31_09805 [Thermoanaerobaculia bacterium]|jgi:ascorbate-specific PTS system EIIC-type component UlaA
MSLRDTAKGVAVRAGLLGVVGLIAGAWLFGVAAKTASALVKFIVGLILLAIGAGLATLEVKKIQRRFDTP